MVHNHRLPLPSIFFLIACLFFLGSLEIIVSAERSTYIVHMDKSFKPQSHSTHKNWYSSIVDSLNTDNPSPFHAKTWSAPSILYTYDNAFHGFSASLSPQELENLKNSPGFVSACSDKTVTVDTTHTTDFLSLNPSSGLWPASNYGEDVIIGVIDTGVWPESESFKDHGLSANIPAKWKGICEEGQDFNLLEFGQEFQSKEEEEHKCWKKSIQLFYFGYNRPKANNKAETTKFKHNFG